MKKVRFGDLGGGTQLKFKRGETKLVKLKKPIECMSLVDPSNTTFPSINAVFLEDGEFCAISDDTIVLV